MELYNEKVMDHFLHPRNVGEIVDADGIGNVGNPVCGDILRLYLKIKDGIISDAKFKTFGCFPAGQEIVSSNGGWQKIGQINKGEYVVNGVGKDTFVVDTYRRDYQGPLINIMPFVSPFNSFRLTPNHPVLCIKRKDVVGARRYGSRCAWLRLEHGKLIRKKPDFVRAENLQIGDYLVFTTNHDIADNSALTKEHMRLFGYYLSEGYIAAKGNTLAFAFNKNERQMVDELKQLLSSMAHKEPKERIRGNVSEVYICSRRLVKFILAHCGKIARHKSLSSDILQLPFSKQRHIIETYMLGDGDMFKRRPHNSPTYRMITTSRLLAIQMQEMLARGGIFASIRQIYKTNCSIGGRRLRDSLQYLISFKVDRMHKFVHQHGQYFLIPVRRLKKDKFYGVVYNLQVAHEPSSYLANGFVVHNCGAAIATSSMVTELVKGKTVDEALRVSNKAVAEALGGLPKIKMHCSVLAEEALKSAIEDYRKKVSGHGQADTKKDNA
jgi:Fe-S cluster assembly protein SufB